MRRLLMLLAMGTEVGEDRPTTVSRREPAGSPPGSSPGATDYEHARSPGNRGGSCIEAQAEL